MFRLFQAARDDLSAGPEQPRERELGVVGW